MAERRGRFTFFIVFTLIAVSIILWKFGFLMLIQSEENIQDPIFTPPVERGPILDRNGRILAIQTRLNSVTAWIPNITNPEETASSLAAILDHDAADILRTFRTRTGFAYIERKITPTESQRIEELLDRGELAGISLEPEYGRNYPEQELAAHLIGYVGIDNIGLEGIEYTMNDQLSPPIRWNQSSEIVYGNQVFLTIDLNIQFLIQEIAETTLSTLEADSVMFIVMDANNGDILAYVSLPSYDPNTFYEYPEGSRFNRIAGYTYEPGSVFKIFTLASFFELGAINRNSRFFCDGSYENEISEDFSIRINCLGVHGWVNPEEILIHSCNTGAASASESVDAANFHAMLQSFGFGRQTNVPLPGETNGLLSSPAQWSVRTQPTIAIGQEIGVSALQIAQAATVFTNNGTLIEPQVIERIVSPEGEVLMDNSRTQVRQVVSQNTAQTILEMMESAVSDEDAIGRLAGVEGLRVSAKTGTAQILDPVTGTYSEDEHIASCLAIFPTDDPEYIVYGVINNPKGENYFGSQTAAPMVSQGITEMVRYLGIPIQGQREVEHSGQIRLLQQEEAEIGDIMPDLTGYPKRLLLPLLEREDLDVIIEGEGWVQSQDPEPETEIIDGMRIRLELE
ncbi:MAG: penicillin-binding transpeptidase domain-containing protein [Spirochaetia bacterium]